MNYKSYPTAKTTPSRNSRKGLRATAFQFNKKMKKLVKKAARLARRIVE